MKSYNKLLIENRILKKFLKEIKNMPEYGDFDCGLKIECPMINCAICMATQALKRKKPKLSEWRSV